MIALWAYRLELISAGTWHAHSFEYRAWSGYLHAHAQPFRYTVCSKRLQEHLQLFGMRSRAVGRCVGGIDQRFPFQSSQTSRLGFISPIWMSFESLNYLFVLINLHALTVFWKLFYLIAMNWEFYEEELESPRDRLHAFFVINTKIRNFFSLLFILFCFIIRATL